MTPGFKVGQFVLERPLGEGGMAEVWLGRNLHIDRPVAVKFLNQHFAARKDVEARFLNEGKRQGSLDHPNIVKVFSFEYVGAQSFLILQYIEGDPLDVRLQRSRMSNPEILRIATGILDALNYAHAAGVVHRDIKPSNVLLDRNGYPYLGDFGIVLAVNEQRVTRTGIAMGTPHYMSPEQISRPAEVDHRSDIYSFGCVLYEMLTGRVPFEGDGGSSDFSVQLAHTQAPPPLPRSFQPDIRPEVEQVVLRCLSKDPAQRYSTCAELSNALRAAILGQTPVGRTELRDPAPPQPARQPTLVEKPAGPNISHSIPLASQQAALQKLNITTLVDQSRMGAFQWTMFTLCGLCLIMDGFDVQAMGYVAPAVIREFGVTGGVMGQVLSAALVGILFGSYLLSMLADKIGRRPVLIGASLYFALCAILTAQVTSINQLLLIRFLGGIGMGAIMPNAMALAGEYSASRVRVMVLMAIGNFFTIGAAIGGFVAAWLIPNFGWRSVFYFGGAVPLVIGLLMLFFLPESLQFLVLHNKGADKVRNWLQRIQAPVPSGNVQFVVQEENRKGVPLVHLFREGRALGTIFLWTINFMNLLNLYLLGSWLAAVVRGAGNTAQVAVLVATVYQVGGAVGGFANGWFIGRLGFRQVLTILFGIATLSIATLGQPSLPLTLLFVAAFVSGWCVPGGQPGVNSLTAIYYPTYLRSTGIGSSLGFGRIGAIIGPVMAGALIQNHWAPRELFYVAAIPAAISAMVAFAMRWVIPEPAKGKVEMPQFVAH